MVSFVIGLVIGVLGASVGWFFVWRNNTAKFEEALRVANSLKKK